MSLKRIEDLLEHEYNKRQPELHNIKLLERLRDEKKFNT